MTKSEERSHEAISDSINHPSYYNRGIEAMDFIASHDLNFSLGNVVKYIVRAGKKSGEPELEALNKALWYLEHEIEMRKRSALMIEIKGVIECAEVSGKN